ncbi:hypothetical protein [Bradyrhizobium sp. STM 3562]|uniref:hypothetical protein n=1 Tax=Bradyrhizobium sp. STM 3562 TaxID=578924 RepID=UPI00388F9E6A
MVMFLDFPLLGTGVPRDVPKDQASEFAAMPTMIGISDSDGRPWAQHKALQPRAAWRLLRIKFVLKSICPPALAGPNRE